MEKMVNINDVIDNATLKPFHHQVLFWCLLVIIFDGYDLVIYGVALPLLMEQWSLTPDRPRDRASLVTDHRQSPG